MTKIAYSEIEAFFATKVNGVHRFNSEDFLRLEAEEKLFHLGQGNGLLDFGCGSADLLVYYASRFVNAYGVDLSDNMLDHARVRVSSFGVANVKLMKADDMTVWKELGNVHLDVITTAAVMQYFTVDQISRFLDHGKKVLKDDGRFAFFDLVDPNVYWMFKYNFYSPDRPLVRNIPIGLWSALKVGIKTSLALLKGKSFDFNASLGNTHLPGAISDLAQRHGMECQIIRSMYYEYRFHAILTKRPAQASRPTSEC